MDCMSVVTLDIRGCIARAATPTNVPDRLDVKSKVVACTYVLDNVGSGVPAVLVTDTENPSHTALLCHVFI